jgi:hypothetical protein
MTLEVVNPADLEVAQHPSIYVVSEKTLTAAPIVAPELSESSLLLQKKAEGWHSTCSFCNPVDAQHVWPSDQLTLDYLAVAEPSFQESATLSMVSESVRPFLDGINKASLTIQRQVNKLVSRSNEAISPIAELPVRLR